jgi:outer membrane scaffolding protein for murein synthesis (MipA/OmpV family)
MNFTARRLRPVILCLATSLVCTIASAAELGDFYNLGPRPAQTAVRVGFVAIAGFEYQGTDERKTMLVPSILYQNSNGFFVDPVNGIGYNFSAEKGLEYGLRVNIETGRSTQDSLPGFEKVDARLNPGAFANYAVTDKLTLRSAVRVGLGDGGNGALLNVGASYKAFQMGPIIVALNASAKYANSSYMQTYFGVSPAQSAASGLKAYQAGAGFSTAQVGVAAGFPVSRQIYAFSSISAQRLLGDAASSPITRKKTQPIFALGAVYSF